MALGPPSIRVEIRQEFEECVDISWTAPEDAQHFIVEMVIDRSDPAKDTGRPLCPPKDAMVKRVEMGQSREGAIQNMPEGRAFLLRVVAMAEAEVVHRSQWARVHTLSPKTREKDLGNFDPMNMPRMNCRSCPCAGYVPFRWTLNSPGKLRCRRCGCHHTDHVMVEVGEILKAREKKAQAALKRDSLVPLPSEALEWDNRECLLWFWTDGLVHPRAAASQVRQARSTSKSASGPSALEVVGDPAALSDAAPVGASSGGSSGSRSAPSRRVSVVTPTTESRQRFHEQLWRVFDAQTWPDKELVVVETYSDRPSEFFLKKAQTDSRVVYARYKRPRDGDWSIGLKRNIGTNLATGEFIAQFDDDDLYAPSYLATMVALLDENRRYQAVKLSSWYVYCVRDDSWHFCDPIAWGLTKGFDEGAQEVRCWSYGYGFSYVYRRQVGLDVWYEDINFGEDFVFMNQLQIRRGEGSVRLFHDDFGICVHVQHGGNTSNSIPVRQVSKDEALDLDIMELSAHFAVSFLPASQRAQRRRIIMARVRLPPFIKDLQVECAVNATAAGFLRLLEVEWKAPVGKARVFRVPLAERALNGRNIEEEERDEAAAEVLGIAFLARLPGAEEHLRPETRSGRQWRKLLERAKQPMVASERLGLRATELWVLPPVDAGADSESDGDAECDREEFIEVSVTCQRSTVKQFFAASGACRVQLPAGSTVGLFREVLGQYLPAAARVLATKPGRGMVVLQDTEALPEEVTVSDFRGNRGFYTRFTPAQCVLVLRMLRRFLKRDVNQEKLDDFERAAKGNDNDYRAQLVQFLSHEIYPQIFRRLRVSIECEFAGPKLMMEAMHNVSRCGEELATLWLEVEGLMRNRVAIAAATMAVERWRSEREATLAADEDGGAPPKIGASLAAEGASADERAEDGGAPPKVGASPAAHAASADAEGATSAEALAERLPSPPAGARAAPAAEGAPADGTGTEGATSAETLAARLSSPLAVAPESGPPGAPQEAGPPGEAPLPGSATLPSMLPGADLAGAHVAIMDWGLLDAEGGSACEAMRSLGASAAERQAPRPRDVSATTEMQSAGGAAPQPQPSATDSASGLVEVCVTHGTQRGEVVVAVPPTAVMLEVKRALARRVGRQPDAELLRRMRLARKRGGTFAEFADGEPLGDRR